MFARIVNLVLLTAIVIAIPLSHVALSKKKAKKTAAKVEICHFPDDKDVGHVIRVSSRAVAAHISKHGDCKDFTTDATGACKCIPCTELCVAALERCLADCPPLGTGQCQADCQTEFNRCDIACHDSGIGGGG